MNEATDRQQLPNEGTADVLPMVIADLQARALTGQVKYGKPLQTNNGRDALTDAYQDALDLCMYLRQMIEERKAQLSIQLVDCEWRAVKKQKRRWWPL